MGPDEYIKVIYVPSDRPVLAITLKRGDIHLPEEPRRIEKEKIEMVVDFYELLGIPKNAGSREIRGAYRRMAEVYHPDKLNLLPESAREEGEDPYYNHLYRVSLDGSGITLLNPGDFDHRSSVSESSSFFLALPSSIFDWKFFCGPRPLLCLARLRKY